MKYVSEYRDAELVRNLAGQIRRKVTRPWTIMEICGGQTHAIVKYALEDLLPKEISLVHGPGCPVCVTPIETIDKAIAIASLTGVILTSFGDMLRVPGSATDLLRTKASGADLRVVYSPLDALKIAEENQDKKVVFFSVGFETTAPANALAVFEAKRRNIKNFSMLCANVLVPPAMEAILSSPHCRIQGFLAAGHVCTVMGYIDYEPIALRYRIPITVTGFEPVDIMLGILMTVEELEQNHYSVKNQYSRVVNREGNLAAKKLIQEVYQVVDRKWRGIGMIPASGMDLNGAYEDFNADLIYQTQSIVRNESGLCMAGEVLQGLKKPSACPAFGKECTPESPLGAPMVSSEGACAAYFRYKKNEINA